MTSTLTISSDAVHDAGCSNGVNIVIFKNFRPNSAGLYSLTSDNCHFSAAVIPAKKTYKSSNLYETSEIFAFLIQEQREHVNTSVETLEKGAGVGKDST